MDAEAFFRELDGRGKKMGVRFGPQTRMSNSNLAMQAGEFAKDHGAYDAYHEAVFHAFFTDCQDIGDRALILAIAEDVGLDGKALNTAIERGRYLARLEETSRKAKASGITAVPTFVIEGYGMISGAQPYERFRLIMQGLKEGDSSGAFIG